MNRKTTLVACVVFASAASGQERVAFVERDFFQLRDELQVYYDGLIQANDPSITQEGGDYAEFKKWNEFWSARLKPGDTFEDYFLSYNACLNGNNNREAGNEDDWHEIGPFDKPNSGATSIGQGSQSGIGPIRWISIDENEPDHLLCGSWSGGIYYTENAGLNWRNGGSDSWGRSGCHHGTFGAYSSTTWYAASDYYFFWSGGVWRTFDSGDHWERIGDQDDFSSGGGIWTFVNKLISDPTDADVLFAATEHRLWKTVNANEADPNDVSWSAVSIAIPSSITSHPTYGSYSWSDSRYIYDLEMDPNDHNILYAAVRFDGSSGVANRVMFWRIMRSTDNGSTWTEVINGPVHAFTDVVTTEDIDGTPTTITTGRNANWITLEMTKANSDLLYVYFGLPGNLTNELWRLTDAPNDVWESTPIKSGLKSIYGGGHGFGISRFYPDDIYLEKDLASSIGRYTTYVNGTWYDYYSLIGNIYDYHVDVEDFVSDPVDDRVVWMADHGGVHRSPDDGATWEWRGNGLSVAEIYRMSSSYSEPEYVALGLYHDANVITNSAYGADWEPDWKQMGGADGQKPMIDPKEGNRVYFSSQGSLGTNMSPTQHWKKSSTHGYPNSALLSSVGDWDSEGALDRIDPATIYIAYYQTGTSQHEEIKRSTDHGATWNLITDFQTIYSGASSSIWRIYPSGSSGNHIYVHVQANGHRLFRTTVAKASPATVAASWQELPIPRDDLFIADIDCDLNDPDICYIAYTSSNTGVDSPEGTEMLYRVDYSDPQNPFVEDLTGSSGTWTPLPNTGVGSEALVLERGSNGGIYIATDVGVYYTNRELMANGAGWSMLGTNLPHTNSRGIEINYKVNKIRLGLYGRGLWEHDLWCPDQPAAQESGTCASDLFLEVLEDIGSIAEVPTGIQVDYRAGTTVTLTPGFHAAEGAWFHAFIHPCNDGGNSFKKAENREVVVDNRMENAEELEERSVRGSLLHPNPAAKSFQYTIAEGVEVIRAGLIGSEGKWIPLDFDVRQGTVNFRILPSISAGLYTFRLEDTVGIHHHKLSILP